MMVVVTDGTHPHEPHEAGAGLLEHAVPGPWSGVKLGIVDGERDLYGVAHPRVALDEVQLLAVRVTELIQPGPVVEADRVHHQGVAVLIVAYGVAPVLRIGIVRMLP